ncbi:DoxX family protein, partial [Halorubrum sp. CGM4_25_10-8A]
LKSFLDESTAPLRRYVPTVLRVGMGVSFVYLGLIQKLADPGSALLVVEKYDLTSVVPVDPGLWVVGAGVTEIAVGLALIAGFFTRGAVALSFVLFTTTLFGLPDDPVLAHVALFGMASAVFTLGSGPLAFDRWFGRPALDDEDGSALAA